MSSKNRALQILNLLKSHYPKAKICLNYSNNWELLAAVILSAQCTDERVNKITKKLFQKYKSIDDYANANLPVLEQDIKSAGFYRNKAKNIKNAAKIIIENFQKKVPNNMDDLLKIPGVARKTANIILGNAYGIFSGIAVDTHVKRLSYRLGLTKNKNPIKIEKDLMKLFDQKDWFKLTYLLIEHGRNICQAKKAKCNLCFINKLCPSAYNFPHFKKNNN